MATPSLPQRRPAQVGVNVQGKPVVGPNKNTYNRQSVQPFGSVNKSVHQRPSAPVSPSTIPVNDKDGGQALHTGSPSADKRGV